MERFLALFFAVCYFAGAVYAEPIGDVPQYLVMLADLFFVVCGLFCTYWFLSTFACVRALVAAVRKVLRAMDDLAYVTYDYAISKANNPEEFKEIYKEQARINRQLMLNALRNRMRKEQAPVVPEEKIDYEALQNKSWNW